MRIAVQTWGSTGDTRPMFALAHGLKAAGHDVTVVATHVDNVDFTGLARSLGLAYRPVPEHLPIDFELIRRTFGQARNDVLLLRRVLESSYFPVEDAMYAASLELCEHHDLIVSHFALHTAKLAAMKTGTPHVAAVFWPGLMPSSGPPYPLPNLGRLGNRLAWRLVWGAADFYMGRRFLDLYRREGVRLRRAFPSMWYSDRLNLYAASPRLWPPAKRKSSGPHQLTGFWSVPLSGETSPPPRDLAAFLDDGKPPVYLGFGTPQRIAATENLELLRDAARAANCRAVIRISPEDEQPPGRDDNIYFASEVAHQHLFPRCAAVVHHGGAGTTHTAARSGAPSIVVGFAGEQMSWGWRLHRSGVAVRPIHRRRATPRRLAEAIRQALEDDTLRAGARCLGAALRVESGVENAVQAIERHFAGSFTAHETIRGVPL